MPADPFDRSWSTTAWLETAGIFDAIAGVLREQASAAALADAMGALDISESALEARFDEHLERAVAHGRLSEAEADAMTDQIAAKPDGAARREAMRRFVTEGPISEPKNDLSLLRKLACGSESELRSRLEGVETALVRALRPRLSELATASAVTSVHELHDKFVQDPRTFELRFGAMGAFYGGLEAFIGSPDPNVRTAMEREHTAAADSGDEFTTDNYEVTTTPTIEWRFVAEPEGHAAAWPAEHKIEAPAAPRRPLTSSQLAAVLRRKNAELETIDADLLLLEEALAARLYTGPMFVKYNDTVRGFGPALAGCKGNRYVTTTHAINSCIVKASKLTKVAKVYRGVAGGVLPDAFWTADKYGVRGGVERAFQSTSYDKAVAVRYAGGRPGASLLLEIDMGMVDRGCELDWISQYPHERECLFAPLTGLQLVRTRVEGGMLVAELRLNINLNALTLEQVIGKMKRAHLDFGRLVENGFVHNGVPKTALAPLHRQRVDADARLPVDYNDVAHFLQAMDAVFAARAAVFAGLRLPETWAGCATATAVQAATMCAYQGEHGVAMDVLASVDLGVADDEPDRMRRVVRWMVEAQRLAPPWPVTLAACDDAVALAPLVAPLVAADALAIGKRVLALDGIWQPAVVARVGATIDVIVKGWMEKKGLERTQALIVATAGAGALLRAAAGAGHSRLVDALLSMGVNPFVADARANTALHDAAAAGHVPACRALLAAGLDWKERNAQGQGADDLAAAAKHHAVIRLFSPTLSDGEFTEAVCSATERLRAASRGDVAALRITTGDGEVTALMIACRSRQLEAV
jgi:hypothetical protein